MRYTITGRNIDVTPGLRAAIEEKIGKLERYFLPDTEIIVTLSVQKDKQKIEVTIPVKGNIIRAEESSNDMYVSIDLVEEIIERQLRKYKNKLIDKKQSAQSFSDLFISEEAEAEEFFQKKVQRDREARKEYRRARTGKASVDDIYMIDIMRRGMENEDFRIR